MLAGIRSRAVNSHRPGLIPAAGGGEGWGSSSTQSGAAPASNAFRWFRQYRHRPKSQTMRCRGSARPVASWSSGAPALPAAGRPRQRKLQGLRFSPVRLGVPVSSGSPPAPLLPAFRRAARRPKQSSRTEAPSSRPELPHRRSFNLCAEAWFLARLEPGRLYGARRRARPGCPAMLSGDRDGRAQAAANRARRRTGAIRGRLHRLPPWSARRQRRQSRRNGLE
jgi:hypothetical protein